MSEVKAYINNQQLLPFIASNMDCMLGFQDNDDTIYLDANNKKEKSYKRGSIAGKYAFYYGDQNVFMTVSKNRNLLVFISSDLLNGNDEYDYAFKMYTFSSILTELEVDVEFISISCHKEGDYLHITYRQFQNEIVDIYVSIDL